MNKVSLENQDWGNSRNAGTLAALWVSEALTEKYSKKELDKIFWVAYTLEECNLSDFSTSSILIGDALKEKKRSGNGMCQVRGWRQIKIWRDTKGNEHLSMEVMLNHRNISFDMSYRLLRDPDMIRWIMLMNE